MASCLVWSEGKRRRGTSESGALRTLALAVFLVLTAAAAAAAPAAPDPQSAAPQPASEPWSVEAPGAAGAPLGLGLDFLVEKQVSLSIDSARTTVTARDLERGTTSTQVLNGDPSLLNRKFGIGWETHGAGAQVPLALPGVPFGPGWGMTPTLVLQAAEADLNLAFHDLPEPQASTSLHGRGLQLGAALDLMAPLWPRSSWYAGGGYRYRFFPRLAVDRGQPVVEPGARVLSSDVRLSRTVGEASLRLGHVFGGDRAAIYLGAVWRRSRITVDDDLVLLQQEVIQQQIRLLSRTGFASTVTTAIGGLDVHLAGPFFARAEVTFGAGDSTVLAKVVVVPAWRPWFAGTAVQRPAARVSEPDGEVPPGPPAKEIQRRAREIADQIAPRLAAIRARFAREAAILGEQPAPAAADVARLLDGTEREVLDVLDAPELAALRDAVSDFFAKARSALGPERAAAAPAGSRPAVHAAGSAEGAVRALRAPGAVAGAVRAAAQRTSLHPAAVRTSLARTDADLEKLATQAAYRDLLVSLCVKSAPAQRAQFEMHPKSNPDSSRGANTDHRVRNVWRGLYIYTVKPPPHFKRSQQELRLNLFADSGPIVRCSLVADTSNADALPCDLEVGDIDKECPQ